MEPIKKKCTRCNVVKVLEDFDVNCQGKYGRASSCKVCRRLHDVERKEFQGSGEIHYLLETSTNQHLINDAKEAYKIITQMGYDLEGVDSVYIQFKRRLQAKGVDTSLWD
jgi:hypothetical protein